MLKKGKPYPTNRKMPNKMWYPEMVDYLQNKWNSDLQWNEYVQMAEDLTNMLSKIVLDNNIMVLQRKGDVIESFLPDGG